MTYVADWKIVVEALISAEKDAPTTRTAGKLNNIAKNLLVNGGGGSVTYIDPDNPTSEEKARHALVTVATLVRQSVQRGGRTFQERANQNDASLAGQVAAADMD